MSDKESSTNSIYESFGGTHNFMHSHGIDIDADGYVEARELADTYAHYDRETESEQFSEESEYSDQYESESYEIDENQDYGGQYEDQQENEDYDEQNYGYEDDESEYDSDSYDDDYNDEYYSD
eukprot:gene1545-12671_t